MCMQARRAVVGSERGQLQANLAQLQQEAEASQQAMAALQSQKAHRGSSARQGMPHPSKQSTCRLNRSGAGQQMAQINLLFGVQIVEMAYTSNQKIVV